MNDQSPLWNFSIWVFPIRLLCLSTCLDVFYTFHVLTLLRSLTQGAMPRLNLAFDTKSTSNTRHRTAPYWPRYHRSITESHCQPYSRLYNTKSIPLPSKKCPKWLAILVAQDTLTRYLHTIKFFLSKHLNNSNWRCYPLIPISLCACIHFPLFTTHFCGVRLVRSLVSLVVWVIG